MRTFTQHIYSLDHIYNTPHIIFPIVNKDGDFLYLSKTQTMQSLKTIKISIIKNGLNFLNLNKGII